MAALTITNFSIFILCLCLFVTILVPRLGQEFLSRCFGCTLSVLFSYLVSSRYTGGKIPAPCSRGKAVLVTGCDTGIGNALARHLDALGFSVLAGCLNAEGREAARLKEGCSGRLQLVQLDVTSDRQVSECVSSLERALSTSGDVLWGVVNNAGTACWGEVEWVSLDRYKQLAEVNLWGTIRVTKAFLPLIRKCKGRVVNMSSMLGRFAPPACSAYSITKYGVQAFTDSLRMEMSKFGVSAVIVEPGNFSGGGSAMFTRENMSTDLDRVWGETPPAVQEVYGSGYFEALKHSVLDASEKTATTSLAPVVEACTSALTDRNPHERYFPGNAVSKLTVWMFYCLPAAITDSIFNIHLGLKFVKSKRATSNSKR